MKFVQFITGFLLFNIIFSCSNNTPKETESIPKKKKVKNIIFLIGDGMGLAQIYAGLTANKGKLNLERCKYIGLSKTYSSSHYITDSAAGATAFSIGKKSYNGAIGITADSVARKTILEIAEANQLATGLVCTSAITHATPASFIAHQLHRSMQEEIAADFLKTDIDVFIGGGKKFFTDRKDKQDLSKKLTENGYQVLYNIDEIVNVKSGKLAGLTADNANPRVSQGRGNMLEKAAMTAINILDQDPDGFFLMIEGSQIDWGGHANNTEFVVEEMIDFDNTISKVLDFADRDGETLVVITADHETGGLTLLDGNFKTGEVKAHFSTDHHTGVMIPVFAYGVGAEAFMGIYENTSIFNKFMNAFEFKMNQ